MPEKRKLFNFAGNFTEKEGKALLITKMKKQERDEIMGLPLQLSYAFLGSVIIVALIRFFIKKPEIKKLTESLATFLIVAQLIMLIIAVGIKDPLFENFSPEIQLIIAGVSGAFAIWKAYLDPMKKRISNLEVGQAEIKTDTSNIKMDVHLIKEKILNLKPGSQ